MGQSENIMSERKKKVLSANELTALLVNPPKELIKEEYDKESILIEGYTIEDEYLILDDSITIDLPLTFQGCTFKSSKLFFIDGMVCNESLTFESCTIVSRLHFSSGIFKKEVLLKYVQVKSLHFGDCTFNKISISCYDVNEVWVSRAKFESFT